jgi:hypothetical protein
VIAHKNGLTNVPDVIAEIGPGNSIGVGLAALISGANKYYALDVVEYATTKRNVEIFDELVELFGKRETVPDESEFPRVKPRLKSYKFPNYILTDERLGILLEASRIETIRDAILNPNSNGPISIKYFAPWYDVLALKRNSVDMIFSQAALEHIEDLSKAYETMYLWLKPSGYMSHQVDFKCHGTANCWNGHWAHSDFMWKIIRGKRPYLLNREPYATHVNLQKKSGFEIISSIKVENLNGIERKDLSPRFKYISDDDLVTEGANILSVKK